MQSPPIIIIICRINSAKVVVNVSCNRVISAEILLFNSPTLLLLKKLIGKRIK